MENNPRLTRVLIIAFSVLIIGLVLFNTYLFYNQLKDNERDKMSIFATAVQTLAQTSAEDLGDNLDQSQLIIKVTQTNTTTPIILYTHEEDVYDLSNISDSQNLTREDIEKLVTRYQGEYDPIEVRYEQELLQTIYYGNSPIINKLKYYPAAILLMILLFVGFVYFFYRTAKSSEQNKLWAGMAKETAHQIGTPLSSLVGWTEILKSESVNPAYIAEIEKDIDRLETITDRFSKVGSQPNVTRSDIVKETKSAYDYLKSRSSKLIKFNLEIPDKKIYVDLNAPLYSWTIENLVRNGIDAMKGKGTITVSITEQSKYVRIWVTDTGRGIPKRRHKKVFSPGVTTKKRGWGLGLSLAKRIIEEYHGGQIRVHKSVQDVGTTMEIQLKLT
ncbi:MAG: HAMP domain-containing sensor histidine kinase [Gilvibacter sp.]